MLNLMQKYLYHLHTKSCYFFAFETVQLFPLPASFSLFFHQSCNKHLHHILVFDILYLYWLYLINSCTVFSRYFTDIPLQLHSNIIIFGLYAFIHSPILLSRKLLFHTDKLTTSIFKTLSNILEHIKLALVQPIPKRFTPPYITILPLPRGIGFVTAPSAKVKTAFSILLENGKKISYIPPLYAGALVDTS